MSKHHRRWKGCCMMCAAWIRGDGKARRLPMRDLRRLGKSRRLGRSDGGGVNRRRPTAASLAFLAFLGVEVAAAVKCPEETLCPDARVVLFLHTNAGRAVFIGGWAGFTAWLVPHLFKGATL